MHGQNHFKWYFTIYCALKLYILWYIYMQCALKILTILQNFNICFPTLEFRIYRIIGQCCVLLCCISPWRWPKKDETRTMLAVWLYTCISNCGAVVAISILKAHKYVLCPKSKMLDVRNILLPVYLTFRNRASYISDGHTATLQTPHFIYFFNKYTYWIF